MLLKKIYRKIQKSVLETVRPEHYKQTIPIPFDHAKVVREQRKKAPNLTAVNKHIKNWETPPVFSIVMPVYNPPKGIFQKTLDSILRQHYPLWELCIANDKSTESYVRPILDEYQDKDDRIRVKHLSQNKGISGASNEALSLATGDFISLIDHDDVIFPDTLFEVANAIYHNPELDFVFTDSAIINMEGQLVGYFFKPDFNWEMFLCHNWVGQLSSMRRTLVQQVGGWYEGRDGQDYDLFLRCIEKARAIEHIPKTLYCWRQAPASIATDPNNKPQTQDDQRDVLKDCMERQGIEGAVSDISHYMFRIHRNCFEKTSISIIIRLDDQQMPEASFWESLKPILGYSEGDVVVLLNQEPDISLELPLPVSWCVWDKNQSLAKNLNQAVKQAKGNYLFFVFQPFKLLSHEGLYPLLEQAQREDVGLVAGKILNHRNTVETAGVILSQQGPLHVYKNLGKHEAGETNSLMSLRSFQLVHGNFAMISKRVFQQVRGFDPHYQTTFLDYDLCLRLEAKDLKNMYTPFATFQLSTPVFISEKNNSPDYVHFKKQWGHLFGKDGNFNFALQNSLPKHRK